MLAQLRSTSSRAWSFPNHNGTLALAELDGHCAELPPLADDAAPDAFASPADVRSSGGPADLLPTDACPRGARRTLFDLYGTRIIAGATTGVLADGATCAGGVARPAFPHRWRRARVRERGVQSSQKIALG